MPQGDKEQEPVSDQEVNKLDIAIGIASTAVAAMVLVERGVAMYRSYSTENFDINTGFAFTALAITAVSTIVTYMMIDMYQEQSRDQDQNSSEQPPLA